MNFYKTWAMQADASRTPLSELVELRREKARLNKDASLRYVGLEHLASDSPFLTGSSPVSASISTNNVFDTGDILFGKLRPNLRKSVQAPFPGYSSTDILVLRARHSVDAGFAARVFQSEEVFRQAVATSIGTGMPRTSWRALRESLVFVPPLPEQRRIAEILDTVDEAIRKTEEVIAKLEQIKKGLLHDLLTRGIDENGELRDPERHPEEFKDSVVGRVPRMWQVTHLGQHLQKIQAGWSPSCSDTTPRQGQWGVLKVSAITGGTFKWQESKALPDSLRPRPEIEVRSGDVLCARANGVAELVGKTILVSETPTRLMLSDKTLRLVPDHTLRPNYLACFMQSDMAKAQLASRLGGSSGQKNISQAHLRAFHLPVPKPHEQETIGNALEAFEERILAEGRFADKLRLLKEGLMDDLLTGRVRVPVGAEEPV